MRKVYLLFLIVNFISLCPINAYDYLTDADIKDLFLKHVKVNYTEEYKQRYVPLPLNKNKGPWFWESKDFPRIISLLEFERFIVKHNIFPEKALAVEGYSPDIGYDPECFVLPYKELFTTSYQTKPDIHNLHHLQLDQTDFDFVMVNQVLEHVYDPIRCLKNIHNYMKKGGILYVSTPTNNLPHETPYHYYTGYTPAGLGAIVKASGFRILEIGQWGNLEYLNYLFQNYDWPDYRKLKKPGLNDIKHPVITWVFAVKD